MWRTPKMTVTKEAPRNIQKTILVIGVMNLHDQKNRRGQKSLVKNTQTGKSHMAAREEKAL